MRSFLCYVMLCIVPQVALGQTELQNLQSKEWTYDKLDKTDGSWDRVLVSFSKLDGSKRVADSFDAKIGKVWVISAKETKDGRIQIQSSQGTYWHSKISDDANSNTFKVICNFDQNLWFDSDFSEKGWVNKPELVPKRYCVEFICDLDLDLSEFRMIAQQAYPSNEKDGLEPGVIEGDTLNVVHVWKTVMGERNVLPLKSSKKDHVWLKKYRPKGFDFKK